jgi:pimeloyl-ACP methyl ester carboxylesterase
MGLIADFEGSTEGYEPVAVPLGPADGESAAGQGAAVLRRRSARPSKRAVIYVHCLGDSFVPGELASWYTERGFHFYVADLREDLTAPGQGGRAGPAGRSAADTARELDAFFASLDAAVTHLRVADSIDTLVVCAHGAGAVIAALWCHARRGNQRVEALVLASPAVSRQAAQPRQAPDADAADYRRWPLLAAAQRRLRRGLEIACPVLVMCPEAGWDLPGGPGGLLGLRLLTGRRATVRLGAHVTWMKLAGGHPAEALPAGKARRQFFDELGRWLSAYLSGQIRDQLL